MTVDELIKQLEQLKKQFDCGGATIYTNSELVTVKAEMVYVSAAQNDGVCEFYVDTVKLISDEDQND